MKYKFISDLVVARIDDDGLSRMSCSVEHPEYLAWLAEGNTPDPADAPQPKTYAELRAAEYPPLLDLIDGLVKDDAAQVQAYKDACLAIKAKFPKP